MKTMTIQRVTMTKPAQRAESDVIGRIEAVVIDEHRDPIETVPGLQALKVTSQGLDLTSDLPLILGSHLMVQVGDQHAPEAAAKRFEVEVVGCKKWIKGHEFHARLVRGSVPEELLRAA